MVLVSPALKPVAVWDFEAEVVVLHHPSTITLKYQVSSISLLMPLFDRYRPWSTVEQCARRHRLSRWSRTIFALATSLT
jgi:hypothetical protein